MPSMQKCEDDAMAYASRHRRPLSFLCAALFAALWSVDGQAKTVATPGTALNRFEPWERGSEWFVGDSLDIRGHARPVVGLVADYGYKPYVLLNPDGSERTS